MRSRSFVEGLDSNRSASAILAALVIFSLCIAVAEFTLYRERQRQAEEQQLVITIPWFRD